jgi:hypothetical protein
MVRCVESPNGRLSHLQDIHADLLRKVGELATLRKQVQRKEAARHAQVAPRNNLRKMLPTRAGDPSHP